MESFCGCLFAEDLYHGFAERWSSGSGIGGAFVQVASSLDGEL